MDPQQHGAAATLRGAGVPAPGFVGGLAPATDPLADACVLIVDDLDSNVMLLERILQRAGVAQVHGITDARLAVDRCVELRPNLVLLDLHMPHLDGHAVLVSLRQALPADVFLPVLVLTADTTTAVRERALDEGANDFLTKPFDRVEVLQRVRNLLAMQSLFRGVQRHNAQLQAVLDAQAEEQDRLAAERQERRARVEAVLGGDALRIVFQPIVDLQNGRTVGVEALARFDVSPQRSPDVWFTEAAEVDLAVELELAAIDAALAQLGGLPTEILLSVNASPVTAMDSGLLELLGRVAGPRILLELTEHTRIEDYAALLEALDELRHQGVRIAVDDAGAGYAGLQQILTLRPDVIKLDLDLTRGVDADPVRRALAASLVSFGRDTGAIIIAEGIETAAELNTLRDLGVPWGQGYHLARPGHLAAASVISLDDPASTTVVQVSDAPRSQP